VSSLLGFAADDIRIAGLAQHNASEVLDTLHLKPGGSLLGFDADAARQALEKLRWVKTASVTREYPNQLRATVVERHAIALWQNGNNVDLIDETGADMAHTIYSQRKLSSGYRRGAILPPLNLLTRYQPFLNYNSASLLRPAWVQDVGTFTSTLGRSWLCQKKALRRL